MLAPASELEAVNSMLASIGESPVTRLEEAGVVDAAMALDALRNVSREVQSRGWYFNTDLAYPLVPTAEDKNIELPRNALKVEPTGSDRRSGLVFRGGYLYNREKHTFKFKSTVKANVVLLIPFEDLPQSARTYITVRAARTFQQNSVGSAELAGFKLEDEARALVHLKEAEAEIAGYNVLDSSSVAEVMLR